MPTLNDILAQAQGGDVAGAVTTLEALPTAEQAQLWRDLAARTALEKARVLEHLRDLRADLIVRCGPHANVAWCDRAIDSLERGDLDGAKRVVSGVI